MWDDSDYVLYLVNTETNPFTGHTQIRFAGGDAELSGGRKNRVFLDNVQLYGAGCGDLLPAQSGGKTEGTSVIPESYGE